MRDNSFDRTIERNYVQKWRFLIREYEEVKAGRSAQFARVGEFYLHHGTCSQTFRKYYNRYLRSGSEADLLPQRRGPKWKTRRMPAAIEAEVLAQRRLGLNRYEIYAVLRERRGQSPSPSAIYRATVRNGLNRRTKPMLEEKRRIIKDKLGELGHVDLHQLSRDCFQRPPDTTAYVISIVDSCSRLAWADIVEGKKALPVMFKALKLINTLNARYGITFAELLTDNGAEFSARKHPQKHPFEAMLLELGITHRYTRPYRPQTNGKVERFWRTLHDDLIDGTSFDDLTHFSNEPLEYVIYYNELRQSSHPESLLPDQSATPMNPRPRSANYRTCTIARSAQRDEAISIEERVATTQSPSSRGRLLRRRFAPARNDGSGRELHAPASARAHQLRGRARQLADRVRGHHRAGLRIRLVVALDVAEVVAVIHHQPVRLRDAAWRQVARPVEPLEARAVAEMKTRDGIERRPRLAARMQEVGRRRPQHGVAQVRDRIFVLPPLRHVKAGECRAVLVRQPAVAIGTLVGEPGCEARDRRQRHERRQFRQLAADFLHHLLDEKMAEADARETALAVRD
jgi:transposase InsO family protein